MALVEDAAAALPPTDLASIRRVFERPAITCPVRREPIDVDGSFRDLRSRLRAYESAAPASPTTNAATGIPKPLDLPEGSSVPDLRSRLREYEACAVNNTTTTTWQQQGKLFEDAPSVKTRSMAFKVPAAVVLDRPRRRRRRHERPAINMTSVADFDAALQYSRAVAAANASRTSPSVRTSVETSNGQQVPDERSVKQMVERYGH